MVAGEDKDLKTHCRNTPGIPLIILNRTVVTLEVPSQVSREKCTDVSGPSFMSAPARVCV